MKAGAVAAAALVAAVAACGGAAADRSPAAVPACETPSLVVWLDTQGEGTAGSTYYRLRFTNLSGRRCTLRGHPGVAAVDLAGRQVGTDARWSGGTATRTVALAPRGTVEAALQLSDVDVFPRARCRPTTAAGLRVYPPGEKRSRLVPFPFRACSRPGPVYLHVRAVAPAA